MVNITENTQKLQNSTITSKCPPFAYTRHWYMSGLEKKVKIGKVSFNYIDYLEAWVGLDCNTYRSSYTLDSIRAKIKEAFDSVEAARQNYNKGKKN